jgi:hypothetical protein
MRTVSNKIMLNLDEGAEISVKGFIAPIEHTQNNFHVKWEALANLQVAEPEKEYPVSVFRAFLPDKPVSVGDYWQIDNPGALALLRQLQPNPNLDMHINIGDSRGLWACLRAYNDELADIVFRIHSAFALTDGWFTPSQFAGHLVIDRIKKSIVFFQMRVPEDTWFDVNWKKHKDDLGFSTDGGVCPQIELRTGTQIPDPEYTESITEKEAERALIRRFYKSQQINWVSLEEALETAQVMQKPIHAISIAGPLADESC